jgi:hypothetical protein
MLEIKEALNIVEKNFKEIFGDHIIDLRLEEIGTKNIDNSFELTVSFVVPDETPLIGLAAALSTSNRRLVRLYKKVSMNKTDGTINSIKMYKNE